MGKLFQSLKMAVKSIMGNKARSLLTMLGIVIGVLSVILLTGIGNGATQEISDAISSMGTKLITVTVDARESTRCVKLEDIKGFVEDNPEYYSSFSPYISSGAQAKYGTETLMSQLEGVDSTYEQIRNVSLESGRFISQSDIDKRGKVCIVGKYIQQELFAGANPIGQTLKLNGEKFTVVGVYEAVGTSVSQMSDGKITIPYTTCMRLIKDKNISTYYVEGANEDIIPVAVDNLKVFAERKLGTDSGYYITNVAEMLDTMNDMMGTMTAMLAGIAGISLVVGGIGVMNIMTVSVSERTKEIGIRKAIGARTSDILLQFLIESMMLSALGGTIGIILGFAVGPMCEKLLGMDYVIKGSMVVIAFTFSVFIGIFFGIVPAKKAAKLNPIDALRTE